MKSYLFRAIIKKYLRVLVAIVLVSSLGCGIMVGMANGFLSLKNTMDEYLDIMNYPDAVINTEVMTRDVLEKISAVPGVDAVDTRLVGNLVVVSKDGYYTMQAMTYSEDEFQGVHYWEKSDKESEYPILMEYRFCKNNNIHAGDEVEIRVEDRTWHSVVRGVITRPEMIATHRIGEMEVLSTDIGYVYIPDEVINRIDNPDVDAAESEWQEKNQEFNEKEKDAEEEYAGILDNLDDAEKVLKEKQKELDDLIGQASAKKDELLKYKEELLKRLKELDEKEKELYEKRAELDQGWEKYHKGEAELASGKEVLKKKKDELDATKKTLDSTRAELVSQLDQVNEKEKELAKTKEDLQNAKGEISKKLEELDETEKKLIATKETLLKNLDTLKDLKEYLLKIKEHIAQLDEIIRKADEYTDVSKWAEDAIDDLDKMLADSEAMVKKLEALRDELIMLDKLIEEAEAKGIDVIELIARRQAILDILNRFGIGEDNLNQVIEEMKAEIQAMKEYREELIRLVDESANPDAIEEMRKRYVEAARRALDRYKNDYGFTDAVITEMIAEIDVSIKEIEDGLVQIDDGLKQIADGRVTLNEKAKEVDEGLRQVAEGERQIAEAKKAITDGIAQIDDGLKQVADGYKEIEKYEKQIKDSEEQLRASKAELDDYEKQWADGKKLLEETRTALNKSLKDIDDALKQIDDEIAKGKDKLADGEAEIEKNRKDANDSWLDVLSEFADVKSELEKTRAELDDWHGYGEFCNQFMIRFEPGADPEKTLNAVCTVIGNEKVKKSYTRKNSGVEKVIHYNEDPLEIMALFIPLLFFTVAVIVECLFMSFMIRQCRREIGILRALGFGSGQVMAMFCGINAIVSVGGILLGMLIGLGVMLYTGYFFRGFFYLYFFHYSFHWGRFILACACTILVGQLSTITSAGYISRVKPSEAMSRPAPTMAFSAEKGILSKLQLSPFVKFSVFSLMRNRLRLIFSLICLSSSVMLIYASISFDFSKNRIVSQLFEDRFLYGCEIYLSAVPTEDFLQRLSDTGYVTDEELVCYYQEELSANGETVERTIKGVEPDTKLVGIYDSKSKQIPVPDEGILLEKHTAEILKVTVGDTVMTAGGPLKVVGIPDECQMRFSYISNENAAGLGKPEMYSVICNVDRENENALKDFLSREENYIYTTITYRIREGVLEGINAFGTCAAIVLAFSVLIGLVVIINTIRTNLQEQKKELCVLRTLGFQYSTLSVRLLSQSGVYYVISCILGIPAGIAVTKLALEKLKIENREYPFVNDFRVYLFALLIVLAYVLISHFISMRTIKSWDLVESVKDKE